MRLSPTVHWKAALVSDKLGHLAEEISKQLAEVWPGFFLPFISKCGRRETMREYLLNKKKIGLDDLVDWWGQNKTGVF